MYVTISVGTLLACAASAGDARRLTIVALSLLAKPGEESLAIAMSMCGTLRRRLQLYRTSRAAVMLACVSQGRRGAHGRPATAGASADNSGTYLSRHCDDRWICR
jgi:hypothetical protein